jgi:predicted transcriptional regulator of viral defense system
MKVIDLIHRLAELDRKGVYILTKGDIEKLFPNEEQKTLEKSLQRMVSQGLLTRASKGVYLNPAAKSQSGRVIEDIAKALRPGCFSYVSLESILSEYGLISQIPVSRITIMTTGAAGTYETPYGPIEFTHTKRSAANIMASTLYSDERPLRIATKEAAIRDLMRVGRNVNMLDLQGDDEQDDAEGDDATQNRTRERASP